MLRKPRAPVDPHELPAVESDPAAVEQPVEESPGIEVEGRCAFLGSSARFEVGEYLMSSPASAVGSRSLRHSARGASGGSANTGVCLKPPSEYGVT